MENILWAILTTSRKSTGKTPFCLLYRSEEVAHVKIIVSTHKLQHFKIKINDDERRLGLGIADERRWASEETQGRMRLAMTRYYNRQVLARQFFVGEMVLRRNEFTHHDMINKLSPKWEPYKVVVIVHPKSYVLKDMQGKRLKNPFNVEHLKKF